jgi:hypothetical protein
LRALIVFLTRTVSASRGNVGGETRVSWGN